MISIRRRLLVWLLSALFLACALAGAITYTQARDEVNELFDRQLRQVALSLRHEKVFLSAEMVDSGAGAESEDDLIVQVWTPAGKLAFSSRPEIPVPLVSNDGFNTVSRGEAQYRTFVLTEHGRTIQVAQPLSARREISATLALRLLSPSLVLIPILGILIWMAVGRGLQPLKQVAEGLGRRSPASMEPLPVRALPVEIAPLVEELNALLRRLSKAMEAQRQFIADAAHELRTPLAAVDLQSQIVERSDTDLEKTEAMARLRGGILRANRLVQQLLTMARLEPGAAPFRPTRIDLPALVREIVAEWSPLAERNGIDLGIVRADAAELESDAEYIRVLAGNLIDNAVKYTPKGGRVDVALCADGTDIRLIVEDDGPGIPAQDRARVFERFHRNPEAGAPGSGLGLSIVKTIADRIGATVSILSGEKGTGVRAVVRFRA
jgi:two-component system, OmpR family, sensor kinase